MSAFNTDKLWNARGADDVSGNLFNLLMTITTVFGLVVFGYFSGVTLHEKYSVLAYVGLVIGAVAGVFVAALDNILAKIGGLVMVAGFLGASAGPFIGQYDMGSVSDIALATALVTGVLGVAGTVYPKSLENWGPLLFIGLCGLIVAQMAELVFGFLGIQSSGLHTILDWVGVLIFSAYIVYDFNRAQYVPKTINNAVSIGISIFLDIINLFLRLLDIFGIKTGAND